MNKKLKKILNDINKSKEKISALVESDKMDEANEEKENLKKLQAKFEMMMDIFGDDCEPENSVSVPVVGKVKDDVVDVTDKPDFVHDFANAARSRFRNDMSEGVGADGGYTVPQDIRTMIENYKDASCDLSALVSTEAVSTNTGSRTYQTKSMHDGFTKVGEGGKIGKKDGPKFEVKRFDIKKYAGYLVCTNELLEDTDANITETIAKWMADEDVATKNKMIISAVKAQTEKPIKTLDDIKKIVISNLGQAYRGSITIVTNDDGLAWLDTLKDNNGRYLLQPEIDPAKPYDMTLCIGPTRVPVFPVPNSILKTEGGKIPFAIGDFKEFYRIFDRMTMSIKLSDQASIGDFSAFESDMTIFRAIERLDGVVIDSDAMAYATLTTGE